MLKGSLRMKRSGLWLLAASWVPLKAVANPVVLDPSSLLAFGVVVFWSLVVESGIATLGLLSCGVRTLPFFVTLLAANFAVYFFAFMPLIGRVSLSWLELGVVAIDLLLIRLLSLIPALQGSEYAGVPWKRAVSMSCLGNLASFLAGWLATQSPWASHVVEDY